MTRKCSRGSCFAMVFAGVLVISGWAGSGPRNVSVAKSDAFDELGRVRSSMYDADMVRFDLRGHSAFILIPAEPKSDGTKPWVWYAPTLLAEREQDWVSPGARHAWIFKRLLEGGVYVAGIDVGESWGNPAGRVFYDHFHEFLTTRYGFSPKPGLLAISRGGLMAYNWAASRPEWISCIGCIYPLCNLAAFPHLEQIAQAYGMTVEEFRTQLEPHNPVSHLQPLAAAGVPILHVHGDHDTSVPVELHSAELARRYSALGGEAEVIVVPGKGHEVVPELWHEPRLTKFFLEHLFHR